MFYFQLLRLLFALTNPCQYEDSNNCYWDAETRGNGKGMSFYVIDDRVYYLQEL